MCAKNFGEKNAGLKILEKIRNSKYLGKILGPKFIPQNVKFLQKKKILARNS